MSVSLPIAVPERDVLIEALPDAKRIVEVPTGAGMCAAEVDDETDSIEAVLETPEKKPDEPVPTLTLTKEEILAQFPTEGKYAEGRRPEQDAYIQAIADGKRLIEGPTGSGKTAVEKAVVDAAHAKYGGPVFWVAPTKAICDQHHREFPELPVLYGSNEVPCMLAAAGFDPEKSALTTLEQREAMYNDPSVPRRDQVPCTMLPCPNRTDPKTGETPVAGALGCKYYVQEHEAKKDGRALATMSYYLFARVFGGRKQKFDPPTALVIDEAHRLADVLRRSLSYEITDWYVQRSAELLELIGSPDDAKVLRKFLGALKGIARDREREPYEEHLLSEDEIRRLISILSPIDTDELSRTIERAMKAGQISLHKEYATIRKLETLCRDIRRYVHAFQFSLPTDKHPAQNYTCAFYTQSRDPAINKKMRYKLVIRCQNVAPLVRKRLVAPLTVALSATIGNPKYFEWEQGIGGEFFYLDTYDPSRRRLYVPTGLYDLSCHAKDTSRRDRNRTLRLIAEACRRFSRNGYRSLVIVVSNEERRLFLNCAQRVGLDAVSYGEDRSARDTAAAFKEGHGQTLVGTEAQYAEGLDLPGKTAPVIFVLRPAYPNPLGAESQFEFQRWPKEKGIVWGLRNNRAMVKVLHACSRNVRGTGPEDGGVAFFMDDRFRKLVARALSDSLKPAYRGNMTFPESMDDAESLLALVFGKAK